MTPRLLALDWGTTRLRATLVDDQGMPLDVRSAESGILKVRDARFEAALESLCSDWLDQYPIPIIASGMIGSRQGWLEAPYLDSPASPSSASPALRPIALERGRTLHLIPGVRTLSPTGMDDVMRGEETQIWGADLSEPSVLVLPGTHSKWVLCGSNHSIEMFRTWMTGELYSVLSTHSILGRLMNDGASPAAFELGVRRALDEPDALSALLFSVRSAGLLARLQADELPDYLSGLLIGSEVAAAARIFLADQQSPATSGRAPPRPSFGARSPVRLIGDSALCARYATAMTIARIESVTLPEDLASRGAWRLARAAGLLETT